MELLKLISPLPAIALSAYVAHAHAHGIFAKGPGALQVRNPIFWGWQICRRKDFNDTIYVASRKNQDYWKCQLEKI